MELTTELMQIRGRYGALKGTSISSLRFRKRQVSLCSSFKPQFAKQVVSRRGKNENVYEMYKNEKSTYEACNTIGFHRQKSIQI